MSTSIVEWLKTSEIGDIIHNSSDHKQEVVNRLTTNLCTLVTSRKVARQITVATDPLTRQLEQLCDLMKNLRQGPPKHNEETHALVQCPSRTLSNFSKSDKITRKQ